MRKNKLLAVICGLSLVATSMPVSLAADVDSNAEVSITEEVKQEENVDTNTESNEEADAEVEKEAEVKEETPEKVDVDTKEDVKKEANKSSEKVPSERAAIDVNVIYSPSTATNGDVTVTLKFNKDVDLDNSDWTKVGGGLIYSKEWKKTFTANATETVSGNGRLVWETFSTVVNVNNIDKTAPELMEAPLYTPNEMTNGDVIVSLIFDEAVTVNADGWYNDGQSNIWKKVFTKNAEEEVSEVVDLAGNKMEEPVKVMVDNIDKDAPYAMFKTFSTVNPTNKDVTVKVTFNEDVTIDQDGWKKVDNKKDVWEKTFAENTVETVAVKDMLGNAGEVKITVDNIDKQAPDILYTVFSTYEPTKYKVVTTITYSEAVDVSTEGYRPLDDTHTVWQKEYAENTEEVVVAADAAGNVVKKPISITNIDTKAPSVMNVFYTPDKDKLTNSDVTVAVVFDEAVTIDAEGWYTDGYSNIWKKVFEANGEETIVATDAAGNTVETTVKVDHIDKKAPVINGVADGEKYDKEVSATIEDENLSEVLLNGQSYDYQGGEIKFTENGEYTLIARDAAGNETKVVFELAIEDDSNNGGGAGQGNDDDSDKDQNDKNDKNDNNKKEDKNKAAKTGDTYNLVIPAVGLLASIAVVVALLKRKFAK